MHRQWANCGCWSRTRWPCFRALAPQDPRFGPFVGLVFRLRDASGSQTRRAGSRPLTPRRGARGCPPRRGARRRVPWAAPVGFVMSFPHGPARALPRPFATTARKAGDLVMAPTPRPQPKKPATGSQRARRGCFLPPRESVLRDLRALGDAVLGDVLGAYRRAGGSAGWRTSDAAAMANALTATEDRYELRSTRTTAHERARRGLRSLRRQLESAVWP